MMHHTIMSFRRDPDAVRGKQSKVKILSRRNGYHGIAMGALAATGIPAYHEGFGPITPGFSYLSAPYAYRNAAEGMSEEEFAKLEEKTRKMLQSADAEWQVTLLRCDTLADAAEKAPKLDRLDFVYFNNDSFVGTCTRDERDAQQDRHRYLP